MNDYKDLLAKYINWVSAMEGTDFIPRGVGKRTVSGRIQTQEEFTFEELEMLWEASGWDEKEGKYK